MFEWKKQNKNEPPHKKVSYFREIRKKGGGHEIQSILLYNEILIMIFKDKNDKDRVCFILVVLMKSKKEEKKNETRNIKKKTNPVSVFFLFI